MGFPCLFGFFWKIIPISYIWKLVCRFFLICDGKLWKIISISSIWKLNFRVFSGLMMGASFENGISAFFWAFLENNTDIFYLKTGFPFFLACNGNLWKIIPISSIWKRNCCYFFLNCDGNLIWKRNFRVFLGFSEKSCQYLLFEDVIFLFFGLVMGTSGK